MIRPEELGRFLDTTDPDQQVLCADQVWRPMSGGGGGTVTSVALSAPGELQVSGSPVTTSGTLTLAWVNQSANIVFAGPASGAAATPGFRAIVPADLAGTPAAGKYWDGSGTWTTLPAPGTGTVTSVQVAVPAELNSSGGPITTSGTITLSWVSQPDQNYVFATPDGAPGIPAFRALVQGDIPALPYVASVALAAPVEFIVSGSPVTSTGTLTLAWANETANRIFAGPATGVPATPTFRTLVAADLPNTAVTPGAYTYASITVDAQGRLTSASSGAAPTGTVTSVALALPSSILTVSGSPVTTSGTLTGTLATQTANFVWAGPTTGAAATPTFRALVAADLPAGTGTVTSVAMTVPTSELAVSGSPITTTGTLALTWQTQTANKVFAGPASGGAATPTFRTQVAEDIATGTPTSGYIAYAAGAGVKPAWGSLVIPPPVNASINMFNYQNFL